MNFRETKLQGAYVVELERREDDRGFFARTWCAKEFEAQGVSSRVVQENTSFNKKQGTLRGMHYQINPFPEVKLIRCISGALYDVIIDLRPTSSTYKNWIGMELTAENRTMVYVPEYFAHGYLTLEDNTETLYLVSEFYSPQCERGVRYDDPAIGVKWPRDVKFISEKDALWPSFPV